MECFHWLKKKVSGKKGAMALKLDMSKAYDRIEWKFVTQTLLSMGFPNQLVHLIERCISSVKYQIMVNGNPSKSFSPARGLRQGDPLSPYLFVLCADVLSGMLKMEINKKKLHGLKIARKAPIISHLLFADDSLLFARATTSEADRIMQVLSSYQDASGQVVNLSKSEVSFSKNVGNDTKDMVCTKLGVPSVINHSKYLGLPVVFGRSKKDIFAMVVERIWKKLKGWKEKLLSRAGKETLIKAVAQAIPSYVMSCYKLPEGVCKEIESMLAKFWWGSNNGTNKVHWMSWDRLSVAKGMGGMGFRGISDFNISLLGKQFWRLLKGGNSLFVKVFKGKYFPRGDLMQATVGFSPSYAWRSILSAKEAVSRGFRWRIGSGSLVRVWQDPWIPSSPTFKPLIQHGNADNCLQVSSLIDHDLGCWDSQALNDNFDPSDARRIASIPISRRCLEDKKVWHFEADGEYSVRSAYHLLGGDRRRNEASNSGASRSVFWKKLWKVPIPVKIRNFVWRLAKNIIPTRCNLQKKGIVLDPTCPLCQHNSESAHHLFMECEFTRKAGFSPPLGFRLPSNLEVIDWIDKILSGGDSVIMQLQCTFLWKIWNARNNCVFNSKLEDPAKVAFETVEVIREFNFANPELVKKKRITTVEQMSSPEGGVSIVQVDAGCYDNGTMAMGCVVKVEGMGVSLSACRREHLMVNPTVAEAMAIRWALSLMQSIHLDNAVLQSDALCVIDSIWGLSYFADLEPIVSDCKHLLACFRNVTVSFVGRNGNVDAHHMVGVGRTLGNKTWIGCIPDVNSGPSCNRSVAMPVS